MKKILTPLFFLFHLTHAFIDKLPKEIMFHIIPYVHGKSFEKQLELLRTLKLTNKQLNTLTCSPTYPNQNKFWLLKVAWKIDCLELKQGHSMKPIG